MGEEPADQEAYDQTQSPHSHDQPAESDLKRTGSVWTAVAHIIAGVIRSGVLSLAWSMSQLGWIGGPFAMLFFASVSLVSSFLLCDCYRSPHPEFGPLRNRSYIEAVRSTLGKKNAFVCGLLARVSLYGTGIVYTFTTASSMRAIQKSNCYHKEGHDKGACKHGSDVDTSYYMLLFGALQVLLSQIPNFRNLQWLSVLAAIMSFSYSFVGSGLGLAKILEHGFVKGSVAGVSAYSAADKVWHVSQALGDIAFAYPFVLILFEIQDTLKSPPSENKTMKKASLIAISITTFFYLCCGCFGYGALGEDTPGNILSGFGFYEPYWLIDFANTCVVLHLVGGYQIFSQPLFANIEKWVAAKYPNNIFVNTNFALELPLLPSFKLNLLRLCFRTTYVASTTAIAVIFPYFNQVIGLKGAFIFWPMSIYFPVEMYFKQSKIEAWTTKWIMLKAFSIVCFFVAAVALVGSVEGVISAKFGKGQGNESLK